jgi:hypothetical protein
MWLHDLAHRSVSIAGRGMEGAPAFIDCCGHDAQIKILRPRARTLLVLRLRSESLRARSVSTVKRPIRAVLPGLDKVELRDEAVDAMLALQFHVRDSGSPRLLFKLQHLASLRLARIVARSTPGVVPGSQERSPREENRYKP